MWSANNLSATRPFWIPHVSVSDRHMLRTYGALTNPSENGYSNSARLPRRATLVSEATTQEAPARPSPRTARLATMSGPAEDEDHTTFFQLDGHRNADGEDPVVSRAAFWLHAAAIVDSTVNGHPGFAADEYLNAIDVETTITAAELCAAGMWRRTDGGYQILDQGMIQMTIDHFGMMGAGAAFCLATGGHEPAGEDPELCRKCQTRRSTATGWQDT
jgi:hypothetical protein